MRIWIGINRLRYGPVVGYCEDGNELSG